MGGHDMGSVTSTTGMSSISSDPDLDRLLAATEDYLTAATYTSSNYTVVDVKVRYQLQQEKKRSHYHLFENVYWLVALFIMI